MATTVLLVGRDLNARVRLGTAGASVTTVPVAGLVAALSSGVHDVLVVDLDEGGEAALEQVRAARDAGVLPRRVLGFYSHVDEALGRAAAESGCEAYPRSRFWRDVAALVGAPGVS